MASFKTSNRKPYVRPASRDGQWLHDKAPTGPKQPRMPQVTSTAPQRTGKLVISNLHYEITPKDLIAIFGQIGTLVREPLIRYDNSGRSTGIAIVSFETQQDATRAKNQFDGILAKGQPMSIAFDNSPPQQPRRSASVPTSLINRIQKVPLADRLSADDSGLKSLSLGPRGIPGPVRNRRPAPRTTVRRPKKPKTAEELDKELDAFMGDGELAPAVDVDANAATSNTTQDVEMA